VASTVLLAVLVALTLARHGVRGLATFAAVALPALVVPAWYCVLSNHSQIHAFFVYRSLPAAVGVLLLAGVVACRRFRHALPDHAEATAVGEVPLRS
jgi:putative effector of murein hydrolase LrgA (UPF0299 family)